MLCPQGFAAYEDLLHTEIFDACVFEMLQFFFLHAYDIPREKVATYNVLQMGR
jgi:hypothetical protein